MKWPFKKKSLSPSPTISATESISLSPSPSEPYISPSMSEFSPSVSPSVSESIAYGTYIGPTAVLSTGNFFNTPHNNFKKSRKKQPKEIETPEQKEKREKLNTRDYERIVED